MGKVVQRLKLRWTGETELIPTSGRVSRVPPASNVLRQFIVRPLRVDTCPWRPVRRAARVGQKLSPKPTRVASRGSGWDHPGMVLPLIL